MSQSPTQVYSNVASWKDQPLPRKLSEFIVEKSSSLPGAHLPIVFAEELHGFPALHALWLKVTVTAGCLWARLA